MKKTVNVRMTGTRAAEMGLPLHPGFDLALRPVEMDTDSMTPAAAWIVNHITATYVVDEVRDVIGIKAVSGLTMKERDASAGRDPSAVRAYSDAYGEVYTTNPMKIDVTFPVYGNRFRRPEDVIESTVRELIANGAVSLESENGDTFALV